MPEPYEVRFREWIKEAVEQDPHSRELGQTYLGWIREGWLEAIQTYRRLLLVAALTFVLFELVIGARIKQFEVAGVQITDTAAVAHIALPAFCFTIWLSIQSFIASISLARAFHGASAAIAPSFNEAVVSASAPVSRWLFQPFSGFMSNSNRFADIARKAALIVVPMFLVMLGGGAPAWMIVQLFQTYDGFWVIVSSVYSIFVTALSAIALIAYWQGAIGRGGLRSR